MTTLDSLIAITPPIAIDSLVEVESFLWKKKQKRIEQIINMFYCVDNFNWNDYKLGNLVSEEYESLHKNMWNKARSLIDEINVDYRMELIEEYKNLVAKHLGVAQSGQSACFGDRKS